MTTTATLVGAPERVELDLCPTEAIHPAEVARARAQLAPDQTYQDLADLFGALADPTRAKIVATLARQELCSCDVAAVAGVSRSAASQHLRLLRTLRLVKSRRAGKLVYYSLDDTHVAALLDVGLAHVGHDDAAGLPLVTSRGGGRASG